MSDKAAPDKLFGLIPMDWRFELTQFKIVRNTLKSRWFPLIPILMNLGFFIIILVAGFVGGFSAGSFNFGIMMVWILWWVALMFILVPGFSRAWCMMCPFPIFGDWIQRGNLVQVKTGKTDFDRKKGGLNLKWPKKLQNMWPMNIGFLCTTFFSGFFTVRPFATFILLGLIMVIAFVTGLIFEKRTFCKYICPISGFQGLYGQFATVELRVKDRDICKDHTPKTCYLGSENGYGCPWFLTPFDFSKNTYCGFCFECMKTCPYDNLGVNLRPPGVDLLVETAREKRSYDEAWKAFIMVGIALVFFLTMQGPYGFLKDWVRGATFVGWLKFITLHTSFSMVIMPAVFFVFVWLSWKFAKAEGVTIKKAFINFSYTLIPLGLGVWVAFSVGILLANGSYILHILSDPFAWGWDLFGTASIPWTPVFTGSISYLQGAILVGFLIFSIEYARRLSQQTYPKLSQAKRGFYPILLYHVLGTIVFLKLYIG